MLLPLARQFPPRAHASCICAAGGGAYCRGEVALYLMFTWLLLHPFPIVLPAHNRASFWFCAQALCLRPLLFLGGAESCGRIYMEEERQACSVG